MLAVSVIAHARDGQQWATIERSDDPASKMIHSWVLNLKQPDQPQLSCCGDADMYWADATDACRPHECEPDEYVAIITDNRGEEYDTDVARIPRRLGTRVPIPKRKIQLKDGNPTEHGVVFLDTGGSPICYTPPPGL